MIDPWTELFRGERRLKYGDISQSAFRSANWSIGRLCSTCLPLFDPRELSEDIQTVQVPFDTHRFISNTGREHEAQRWFLDVFEIFITVKY
jgi:hypothetical protein